MEQIKSTSLNPKFFWMKSFDIEGQQMKSICIAGLLHEEFTFEM